MRRTLGLIAPAVAVVLTFGITPAHASTPPAVAAPSAASADGLAAADFAWVNVQRVGAGVAPLQVQSWAQGVAQTHSVDMAYGGTIYHNMTGYMSVGRSAMGASFLGENVAMGTSIDYAQSALINSPAHRQNILDPRFNYLGIGAATDAAGQVYITEDFAQIGSAPAAQPAAQPAAPAAPKPVSTPAPAPKPAVAPKPVVAPKPAPVTTPAAAPAIPATPVAAVTPSPTSTAAATPAAHAAGQTAAMKPAGHATPVNHAAVVLYTVLGLLAATLALGLGYKLTRFLPGR